MAMQEDVAKTLVWWNICNCPVPRGYDPRFVGRKIRSVLKDSGYCGPVTITAIGKLTPGVSPSETETHIPSFNVLQQLSSTGISLIDAHEISTHLYLWMRKNPPPANIMLICGPEQLGCFAGTIHYIWRYGYKILLAYSQRPPSPQPWDRFLIGVSREWQWTSLLTGVSARQIIRPALEGNGTLKSPWFSGHCEFSGQNFEDFSTHLKSIEHAHAKYEMNYNPTYVLWDIENCQTPNDCVPEMIGRSIDSWLAGVGFVGPLTMIAVATMPYRVDEDLQRKLGEGGILFEFAGFDSKEASNHKIRNLIHEWALAIPPPANLFVISGDGGFDLILKSMGERGYTILVSYLPASLDSILLSSRRIHIQFRDLLLLPLL